MRRLLMFVSVLTLFLVFPHCSSGKPTGRSRRAVGCGRRINSIQTLHDDKGWRILSSF